MYGPVPLAIVQHGNQYLITNGYENREGLDDVLQGFSTIFALHLKYRVPLNLHLAGTLIEAIAWHAPEFFAWIKELRRNGLLEVVGSTYSQNVMTLFSCEHNLRQLSEALRLYRRHLGVEPWEVKGFWVPERVWDTEKLASLLRSPQLMNGGYEYVLVDDRLTYPTNGCYQASERECFDAHTAPARCQAGQDPGWLRVLPFRGGQHLRPYRIVDGEGLVALPMSGDLRYCIPPGHSGHWARIKEVLALTAAAGAGAIAVYGDDLEKAAALGPWTCGRWQRAGVTAYERLLQWLKREPAVAPVLLSPWLASHPPHVSRAVDPGTFFELAYPMRAEEDYRGWWQGSEWEPYRELLTEAETLLCLATPTTDDRRTLRYAQGKLADDGCVGVWACGRDGPLPDAHTSIRPYPHTPTHPSSGLWELAWKQLMACSYETAWHVIEEDGTCRPAPWSRALASHVRSVLVVAAAAAWQEQRDGRVHVERLDVDRDGIDEVVLKNDHLYAVLAPACGGRLVYLFDLTAEGGRLVVGNPADDWNWQEEPNRFMAVPRNHPGAFADVEHENDHYEVLALTADGDGVEVRMLNCQEGCGLRGAAKSFRLGVASRYLEASYRLPEEPERFSVELALSPDYLALLREGRRGLRPLKRQSVRGWRNGATAVWVHLSGGEPVLWDLPAWPECGHGMLLRVTAYRPAFRIHLGVGAPPSAVDTTGEEMQRYLQLAREAALVPA